MDTDSSVSGQHHGPPGEDAARAVTAGSTVYPAVVWSGSTGYTLLIEYSMVPPGHPDLNLAAVSFGVLRIGHNTAKFTPLPAPGILAISATPNSALPEIAW